MGVSDGLSRHRLRCEHCTTNENNAYHEDSLNRKIVKNNRNGSSIFPKQTIRSQLLNSGFFKKVTCSVTAKRNQPFFIFEKTPSLNIHHNRSYCVLVSVKVTRQFFAREGRTLKVEIVQVLLNCVHVCISTICVAARRKHLQILGHIVK